MSGVYSAIAIGAGAVIGGTASYFGAKEQSKASRDAANANLAAGQDANALQQYMYDTSRADLAPYRTAGQGALYSLTDLMGIPMMIDPSTGQAMPSQSQRIGATNPLAKGLASPMTTGQPVSPTGSTAPTYLPQSANYGQLTQPFNYSNWQDPGYAFRLQQGTQALDRSAAARGNLFSGGMGKALTQYGQDMGSNEFMNAYNRWNTNQGNLYNRLAGLAGTGQTATNQTGQLGMNAANTMGQNTMNAANLAGQNNTNAAMARASGYGGIANAANAGVNNYMMYSLMNQPSNSVQYNPYGMPGGAWAGGY